MKVCAHRASHYSKGCVERLVNGLAEGEGTGEGATSMMSDLRTNYPAITPQSLDSISEKFTVVMLLSLPLIYRGAAIVSECSKLLSLYLDLNCCFT